MLLRESAGEAVKVAVRQPVQRRLSAVVPFLLILPGFAFVAAFTIYPILSVFYHSLMRQNLAHPTPSWIGLGNFADMIHDPLFRESFVNTVLYVVLVVPAAVVIGLLIAMLVNQSTAVGAFLRTTFFYPIVLPLVSVASVWLFVMTPEYGLLSKVTQTLHIGELALLRSPGTALIALAIVGIWRQAGFYAIFLLAGLQGIDREVENAARLDGAGRWHLTWNIRVPLLWPTLIFVLTLAIINAWQTLDLVYVMTQGGPSNSTDLLLFHIYETQFSFSDTGAASALSVVFLIVIAAFSAVQIFVVDRLRGETVA
ncbi:MAG TPA: sugar ABC transporter permease [Dehalococcoidia bacterium]|nr:sugar ABC transporter permease [Dehalococcoidia bacterium]